MSISRKRICFSDHAYSSSSSIATAAADILDPSLLISASSDESLSLKTDQELCSCVKDTVLLKLKDVDSLGEKHIFHFILNEMQEKCPTLLAVLNSAVGKKESSDRRFATISTIYGMIIHSRNNKASAIQKIYTSLAIRYHADNELLSRMNKVHIMMSAESKRNIISEFGQHLQDKLVKDVSEGRNGKLNGDNLDIRVITNDIRMKNKNKDYHFFASDYILDRVDESSMPVLPQTAEQPHAKHFLPSTDETLVYRESLKVLLSRVLVQHIPAFSWMKNVATLPAHNPHLLEEDMAKISTVHMLPISLHNEVSYDGCIHIMDEYVKMVNHWYSKAGRGCELEDLKVPVGGDQLTRCRLQGAKSLRAGAHTQQERFEQLYPIVIELFHTLQDFLEVII
ncbi:uncharacterized protein LOC117318570 [Pecten maximus]|uniref:uncharacterized protein LOC117318570 n=1 Tax=Pecten maximus TaxID=6579 RepID=UPI0014585BCB|nr:uncharacterized protein LOC117318570 [Pecten maximus]